MMNDLVQNTPVVLLVITLLIYAISLRLYQSSHKSILLLPVVTGITLVVVLLTFLDIEYTYYFKSVEVIHFLLGTATVALAVPLRNHFHLVIEHAYPLTISLAIMAVLTPGLAVLSAWFFGADTAVLLSLAPKSISTPFAIGVAKEIGGYPSLVATIVIITGAIVAIISVPVFTLFSINNPIAQGFSMGLVGHGIATATAFEISIKTGSFSALAMGLMGLSTSVILPYLVSWFF
ncbi:MAG: putative effector of murein hydrolase [Oleiphilaceae bacterium]|jgi:putative effector of murein hydrolase